MTLRKKVSSSVTLLKRLVGAGQSAGAKTLCTAALSLVYSTAEYYAPIWCRSASRYRQVLNDHLRIVTGCLRPTPTEHLPLLSGIHPAEILLIRATLSLTYCEFQDPDHTQHDLLSWSSDARQETLRSRRPFMPAARNQLINLTRLGIRVF